jgi:hypothetical protein
MFGIFKDNAPAIPLLDGPLSPNDLLENASAIAVAEPDDMCVDADGSLLVSSGRSLLRLTDWDQGRFAQIAEFDTNISSLACREDGLIGVGLEHNGAALVDQKGKLHKPWQQSDVDLHAIRACRFSRDGALIVADACISSSPPPYLDDLFLNTRSGRLLKLAEDGRCDLIADGLMFPHGIIESTKESLLVSESWSKNLCLLTHGTSAKKVVVKDLAGYGARIHRLQFGGYALACFARRDPLIDFILSETEYLSRMKTKLSAKYWISPRLSATIDYRFPIQSGATRLFGEIKPWAPSFSYGLVIILNEKFMPLTSAQSRANGKRHGITTALEWRGDLIALSKGNNELLKVKSMEQLL